MQSDYKTNKGVKVMKVNSKKEVIKEKKISEQPEYENDVTKELHIQCPHCNKELYIKRDTYQCLYCKDYLDEVFVRNLFLPFEELDIEKINKQSKVNTPNFKKSVDNKALPKRPERWVKKLLILCSIFSCIYFYIKVSDDGYMSIDELSNPYSNIETDITPENFNNAYLIATALNTLFYDESVVSGMDLYSGLDYLLYTGNRDVVIHIDSTSDYGVRLITIFNPAKLNTTVAKKEATLSFDRIANGVSSSVGYDVKFTYIFDSDYSNVIYSVIGDHEVIY